MEGGFFNKKRSGPKMGMAQSNKAVKPKNDGKVPKVKALLTNKGVMPNKGFVNKAGKIS